MRTLSRRYFLGALGCAPPALRLQADPLGMPIGCQVYPVRDALGKDFEGTLGQLAAIGYRAIEMCSPAGYAKAGFGPLANMKASEIRQKIQAAGLRCESCHFNFRELKESLDERIAWAKELGLKQMVCSTFGLKPGASLADWTRAADELNKIGEQVNKNRIEVGFHNHNFEFQQVDGVLVYDHLMSKLDAKLVKMQFQVSVIGLGYEAATYFKKYPGRFISIHLQDWLPADKTQVAVGRGVVDWPALFRSAKTAGVKNYFVELDMDALKASYPYLHDLKV